MCSSDLVGPAILASALQQANIASQIVDLEILAWSANCDKALWPKDRENLHPQRILNSEAWSLEICAFADRLAKLAGYAPGDPLAISTMGYEQILATLALTRLALDNGSRVILGGQYWTERTAKLILETVRSQNLTITTGDGYEAIINWYRGKPAPVNSFAWNSEIGRASCRERV